MGLNFFFLKYPFLPLFKIAFLMSLRSSSRESFLSDDSLSSDWSSVFEFLLESNVDSKIGDLLIPNCLILSSPSKIINRNDR